MTKCYWCGEEEELDIFELWPEDHAFQIITCCEQLHEEMIYEMNEDPENAAKILRHIGIEQYTGHKLRRLVIKYGDGIYLDHNLDIRPITLGEAKEFVRQHHEHNPPPAGWRFGASIWNWQTLIGVAMVGRPVARMLDHKTIVEVNRLCVRRDVPDGLRWNACSQLYGWAAREARKRGFAKIVTYTLESELGTTLRAAGWGMEHLTRGGTWDRPSRHRQDKSSTGCKVRWARELTA